MQLPSKEDLKALGSAEHELTVSIYLPTHEAGAATRENHIRFKNRLHEAGELLVAQGYDAPRAEAFLGEAQRLVDDDPFWQSQRRGLAVFITEAGLTSYPLPFPPDELTVVSERSHLKPLLPLLSDDGHFYVLAMSLQHARLLGATRYSVSELPLEGVPTSLADALRFDDDPEPTLRAYASAGTRGGAGDRLGAQGAADAPDRKENTLRFFKAFDKGLKKLLEPRGDRVPLVFAGNVSHFPIYGEANHYNGLFDRAVECTPEELSDEALHERAWALVAPIFEERRGRDAEVYAVKAGSDPERTCSSLTDVLPAAHDARVQTLFIPLHERRWGRYDAEARTLDLNEARTGYDLFDLAAVQTLTNGGTVYAVQPGEMPGGGEVAAVYRY